MDDLTDLIGVPPTTSPANGSIALAGGTPTGSEISRNQSVQLNGDAVFSSFEQAAVCDYYADGLTKARLVELFDWVHNVACLYEGVAGYLIKTTDVPPAEKQVLEEVQGACLHEVRRLVDFLDSCRATVTPCAKLLSEWRSNSGPGHENNLVRCFVANNPGAKSNIEALPIDVFRSTPHEVELLISVGICSILSLVTCIALGAWAAREACVATAVLLFVTVPVLLAPVVAGYRFVGVALGWGLSLELIAYLLHVAVYNRLLWLPLHFIVIVLYLPAAMHSHRELPHVVFLCNVASWVSVVIATWVIRTISSFDEAPYDGWWVAFDGTMAVLAVCSCYLSSTLQERHFHRKAPTHTTTAHLVVTLLRDRVPQSVAARANSLSVSNTPSLSLPVVVVHSLDPAVLTPCNPLAGDPRAKFVRKASNQSDCAAPASKPLGLHLAGRCIYHNGEMLLQVMSPRTIWRAPMDEIHRTTLIVATDTDGVVMYWNEGMDAATNFCSEEMVGRDFASLLLTSESIEAYCNIRDGALRERQDGALHAELQVICKESTSGLRQRVAVCHASKGYGWRSRGRCSCRLSNQVGRCAVDPRRAERAPTKLDEPNVSNQQHQPRDDSCDVHHFKASGEQWHRKNARLRLLAACFGEGPFRVLLPTSSSLTPQKRCGP